VPSRQQFDVLVLKSRRNENALRQKALKLAEVSHGSRQHRIVIAAQMISGMKAA
jgi:hypothetical protein